MPFTLDATLAAAMDAGVYEPYLRVLVNSARSNSGAEPLQPLSFVLRSMSAVVTIERFTNTPANMQYFALKRGILSSGTVYSITSIWFKVSDIRYNGRFVTLTGHALDESYRTCAANGTFQDVLESIIGQVDGTGLFEYEGTAAWKNLQFYPLDEVPTFSRATDIVNILKQKYLVFITQAGWDDNGFPPGTFVDNYFLFCGPQTRAWDWDFTDVLFNGSNRSEDRRLIYKDDNGDIHDQGSVTLPIHNMGYLELGSAFPAATTVNNYIGARSTKLPVHLKRRTGDQAFCEGDGTGLNEFTGRVVVTEVFNPQSTPAWYQIIEPLVWFSGSEGNIQPALDVWKYEVPPLRWEGPTRPGNRDAGSYSGTPTGHSPSGSELVGTFKPVFTGRFVEKLSDSDNNVQQALETLDRHTHAASEVTGGSGNYAPTCTAVANVDSTSAVANFTYIRLGNAVLFGGNINIDATAAGVLTRVRISLPIASNFTNAGDLTGTGGVQGSDDVVIAIADTTNKAAEINYTANGAANTVVRILMLYVIK